MAQDATVTAAASSATAKTETSSEKCPVSASATNSPSLFSASTLLPSQALLRRNIHSWNSPHSSVSTAFAFEHSVNESQETKNTSATSAAVGGEGVEISKLPISPSLISGLAKRGITSLFPIQVQAPLLFLGF